MAFFVEEVLHVGVVLHDDIQCVEGEGHEGSLRLR